MKASIVIPLALMGLFSVGTAYAAMTGTQAKQLAIAAYKGNADDLAKLEAASKSGDAAAQTRLGDYWREEKNYTKADYWWEKAVAQGNARAELNLGIYYIVGGRGVPQDYAKAIYLWKKAADQGNANAEDDLGWVYHDGEGVPPDNAKAIYWLKKAAAQGGFWGRKAQHSINTIEHG